MASGEANAPPGLQLALAIEELLRYLAIVPGTSSRPGSGKAPPSSLWAEAAGQKPADNDRQVQLMPVWQPVAARPAACGHPPANARSWKTQPPRLEFRLGPRERRASVPSQGRASVDVTGAGLR